MNNLTMTHPVTSKVGGQQQTILQDTGWNMIINMPNIYIHVPVLI